MERGRRRRRRRRRRKGTCREEMVGGEEGGKGRECGPGGVVLREGEQRTRGGACTFCRTQALSLTLSSKRFFLLSPLGFFLIPAIRFHTHTLRIHTPPPFLCSPPSRSLLGPFDTAHTETHTFSHLQPVMATSRKETGRVLCFFYILCVVLCCSLIIFWCCCFVQ